jgi:hypothetical protein
MSFTETCDVERACRIAELTSWLIDEGVESIRMAHDYEGATLEDVKAVVPLTLEELLDGIAGDVKARPGYTPSEEFHVRVSEGRIALRRAVAVLFPSDEE